MSEPVASLTNRTTWAVLILFLLACFTVAGVASLATTPEIDTWYQSLTKPGFTPPNWLFGPVWTTLYAMMAVAAWLVWRAAGWPAPNGALWFFTAQLLLNFAWSFIFFKFHLIGWAVGEIILLWVAIAVTLLKFAPISKLAAGLLLPYLAWVTYAAALNFALWRLNS